ncbi:MAG: prepilin-type N-terminal cleavage/methylation domain-containing protein [Gemmatimonadaceae bacterium]|nr:prepilin-type N-terminal cleavage/methylation domain-containing protein [Gemmatimonadaceae bacterium]
MERARGRAAALTGSRRGFTLLELVVVLIMVGLIAGWAVPRLNYEKFRAEAAMRTVRSVMQGAHRNAIMRQTNVVVGFNLANNTLEILEDADNDCMADPAERKTVRPLDDGAKFSVPPTGFGGTAVSGALVGPGLCNIGGLKAIQFLRDGATATDLDIYLTSSRGATLDYRLVRVAQASGRTEAYRYDGTTWKRTN